MTKLYKAGLAVLAIALLTSSVLAFSPVWEQPDDVIVGGNEGGGIVFTDAYDVFDYVSDEDNLTTTLSIVFAEGPWDGLESRGDQVTDGATSNDLTINDKAEVDYSGLGGVPLNDQSLLADTAKHLTTPTNGNVTFRTSDTSDLAVVYIASDGVTSPSVSNVFRLRGIDAHDDELTKTVTVTLLDSWNDVSELVADWVFLDFGGNTPPTSGTSGGLQITTPVPNNSNDSVAWWQLSLAATKVPVSTGDLIRARWTVSSTAATSEWPAVRMGFFADNNAADSYVLPTTTYVPDPGNSRTYVSFYGVHPGLVGDFNVRMFVIDSGSVAGGTTTLESLVVDSIVGLDALFTDVAVVDAGGDFTMTDVVNLDQSSGDITFSATADTATWNVTGYSGTAGGNSTNGVILLGSVVTLDADSLYRMRSTVSSTQAKAVQPSFAFRMFNASGDLFTNNQLVTSPTVSDHMAASGSVYDAYYVTTGVDGEGLRVSMDIINSQSLTGSLSWDRAVISSVDLGLIP